MTMLPQRYAGAVDYRSATPAPLAAVALRRRRRRASATVVLIIMILLTTLGMSSLPLLTSVSNCCQRYIVPIFAKLELEQL